jgi:GntR family transcriptional regulator
MRLMSYIRYDALMAAENHLSPDNSTSPTPEVGIATPSFSPLYQQIKLLILQSLQSGEWKPSTAIPSEMELAARFKVSQGTVRKAIDELSADNLLIRRQGKGTFVATHAERQVQYRFLRLYPNNGDLASDGPTERHIVQCIKGHADTTTAQALGLATGDDVLMVRRVLSFSAVPTILEDIWLPGVPFEGLTAERLAAYDGPMYALFETEFDVKMVRAEEKIRAILPDNQQSHLLRIPLQTPVLSVERIAYTYNDTPMELRRGLYLTDTHYYRNLLN